MATLTVTDERLSEVDEFAKSEERSRDEIVDEAIDFYLRQKSLSGVSEWGREMAKRGYTEDEVMEIINEEVHRARAERRGSAK